MNGLEKKNGKNGAGAGGAKKGLTIGLVGNPNSGKTTVFNGLTGSHQHIGNWPGVTVEKKEGTFHLPDGREVRLVDLPGIYSLTAASEDERAALGYVLSHEADFFINIVDATALERNLYLTLLLCKLHVPMVVVVTMMDIAEQRKISIDLGHLSQHLGVPVVGVTATREKDIGKLRGVIAKAAEDPRLPKVRVVFPNELEQEIDILASASVKTSKAYRVDPRWVAKKALEGDPMITRALVDYHDMAPEVLSASVARCTAVLKESPDIVLAEARYGTIAGLVRDVVTILQDRVTVSEKIDKVVLNRLLGIPIFLLIMYVVFWVTQNVGSVFIDFFDILGGTVFVDGMKHLLGLVHTPEWITALLAGGIGTGLQTMATFLPPIFFMFLCLAILEDSGYMARAAFVMDRFMRRIGLPGKSFVPMLVGFGCSVPAIMATRTLESKRDRFLTIFMAPFMSCSAKLPVYVVFGAAFFAKNPGRMVFYIYLSGIILGVLTGLVMKHTLFQGEPSHFIMELPPYHVPRPKHIFLHTWERLRIFLFRAGKVIVPMVLLLGMLNTLGRDGTIGHEDSRESLLATAGSALTPIFEPMGVERDNWPATVSIFTGLFAKEAVIGTMTALYGQKEAGAEEEAEEKPYSFWGGVKEAFAVIPENLSGVFGQLADPLAWGDISGDEEAAAEAADTDVSVFTNMRKYFSRGPHQAFAYLLFILLYVPCMAAMGVAARELGKFYGVLFMGYLTTLGWCVATLYYQIAIGHQPLWIAAPVLILAALFGSFRIIGRRHKVDMI